MWTITGPGKVVVGTVFTLAGLWILWFLFERNYTTEIIRISIGSLIELWFGLKLTDIGIRTIFTKDKK
jgi:hypothetical protein